MDESTYRKWFYAIAVVGGCILGLLAWLLVQHILSLREFEIAVLIWWIVMFVPLFLVIRSHQREIANEQKKQIADGASAETLDRDRCIKNIRTMKNLIVVFAVLFAYGLLATRDTPNATSFCGCSF